MPAHPCGFYPFWFWNDRLEADELRWQVAEMARAGCRGFVIHPRQGLGQPYLSESFILALRVALAAAAAAGLEVYLYDEFPYPSGVAGGAVTLGRPEFHATRLVQRQYDGDGGLTRIELPRGQVLALLAVPVGHGGKALWAEAVDLRPFVGMTLPTETVVTTAMTPYHTRRYFASEPTPVLELTLPPGPHRILASVQVEVTDHKYFGHFADVLNPAAMQAWIQATHERYRQTVGAFFGTVIKGIFCDETTPGWSSRLLERYRECHGMDLAELLPALQDASHPSHERVRRDLYQLRYDEFVTAFERPLHDWCAAAGIQYAAEKNLLRLDQLRWCHLPGGDPGHTRAGATPDILLGRHRANARAAVAAAQWYGRPGALAEFGHSLGWGASLEDMRILTDGLMLLGITHLMPHAFFYSTHGPRKHDAPPSFFFQMPWWPLFPQLTARVEALGQALAGTQLHAPILLIDPSPGLPDKADESTFTALLEGLRAAHRGFTLADLGVLERARWQTGVLWLDEHRCDLVVLPPMRQPEPALLTWLARHEAAGGQLVRLADGAGLAEALAAISSRVAPDLALSAADDGQRALWLVKRVASGGRALWFLLNPSLQSLAVTIEAGEPLREVPLETHGMPLLERLAPGRYSRLIGPGEALLLAAGEASSVAAPPARFALSVPERVSFRPLSPNRLRLDDWELELRASPGVPAQVARVSPAPLSNQLAAGQFSFCPRQTTQFGVPPELGLPQLRLRYRVAFEVAYETPTWLLIEPGTLVGDWSLRVNDEGIFSPTALVPVPAGGRGCLGLELTHLLRGGQNELVIDCVTDRLDGGLREPLYLAGEFGVRRGPLPCLVAPQTQGQWEDYDGNGLPWYSGLVEYQFSLELDELPEGEHYLVDLELPTPGGAGLTLSCNAGPWHTLPWRPQRLLLPSQQLQVGPNALRLRVHGDLLRTWENRRWDEAAHRLQPLPPPSPA